MKTTKVLQTNISETNILEVSDILNTSTKNRVAICNANTLVRSVRNVERLGTQSTTLQLKHLMVSPSQKHYPF